MAQPSSTHTFTVKRVHFDTKNQLHLLLGQTQGNEQYYVKLDAQLNEAAFTLLQFTLAGDQITLSMQMPIKLPSTGAPQTGLITLPSDGFDSVQLLPPLTPFATLTQQAAGSLERTARSKNTTTKNSTDPTPSILDQDAYDELKKQCDVSTLANVKALLEKLGGGPSSTFENGQNLLHLAAITGRSDLFQWAYLKGANTAQKTHAGRSVLDYLSMDAHAFILKGRIEKVRMEFKTYLDQLIKQEPNWWKNKDENGLNVWLWQQTLGSVHGRCQHEFYKAVKNPVRADWLPHEHITQDTLTTTSGHVLTTLINRLDRELEPILFVVAPSELRLTVKDPKQCGFFNCGTEKAPIAGPLGLHLFNHSDHQIISYMEQHSINPLDFLPTEFWKQKNPHMLISEPVLTYLTEHYADDVRLFLISKTPESYQSQFDNMYISKPRYYGNQSINEKMIETLLQKNPWSQHTPLPLAPAVAIRDPERNQWVVSQRVCCSLTTADLKEHIKTISKDHSEYEMAKKYYDHMAIQTTLFEQFRKQACEAFSKGIHHQTFVQKTLSSAPKKTLAL